MFFGGVVLGGGARLGIELLSGVGTEVLRGLLLLLLVVVVIVVGRFCRRIGGLLLGRLGYFLLVELGVRRRWGLLKKRERC